MAGIAFRGWQACGFERDPAPLEPGGGDDVAAPDAVDAHHRGASFDAGELSVDVEGVGVGLLSW